MSSSWTQADLDKLEEVIKSGLDEIEYKDKKLKYRGQSELLKLRDLIRRELAGSSPDDSVQYLSTSKGL
jgi:hypothetical protein